MSNKNHFDIIIAGAGAAGLSLLWHIMDSSILLDKQVLLIDQSFEPTNDKTWCFWEDLEICKDVKIHHTWNELQVKFEEKKISQKLNSHHYHCIRSEDFSKTILQNARSRAQITLLEAGIIRFDSDGNSGHVQTTKGTFTSKNIFQSVLSPPDLGPLQKSTSLLQHFLGWDITTSSDLFDPNIGTFMDFDVPQIGGTSFIYLLPFAKNRALVEFTIFSKNTLEKQLYRKQISDYLKSMYDLSTHEYSMDREEFGVIPMEDRVYPATYCDHVWNIGTVGGLAKPSTGYTFNRIQKHSSEITDALINEIEIPRRRASSYRFRVYDCMMLYLMVNEQKSTIDAFNYLFEKNDFDLVLDFLSEKSTIFQEISIFSKMPYLPFFRSFNKLKHRIFSGF